MLPWLTTVVLVLTAVFGVAALWYAVRGRVVDDLLLLVAALLELALLAQVVVGLVLALGESGDFEKPVFLAYLVTLPFIPPFVTLVALKEKTRWAMLVVLGAAFVIAVLVGRLVQVWSPVA